jgi:acetate kinase
MNIFGQHQSPGIITGATIQSLEELIDLAPNHLPAELAIIRLFREAFVDTIKVACYDTAFHRKMPWYAQYYGKDHHCPSWEWGQHGCRPSRP